MGEQNVLDTSRDQHVTDENSEIMQAVAEFRNVTVETALSRYVIPLDKAINKIFRRVQLTDEDKNKIDQIKQKHLSAFHNLLVCMFDEILESEPVQLLLNKMFELEEQLSSDAMDMTAEVGPIRAKYVPQLQAAREQLEAKAAMSAEQVTDAEQHNHEAIQKLKKFEQLLIKVFR